MAAAARANPAGSTLCDDDAPRYEGQYATKKIWIVDPGGPDERLFPQNKLTIAGQYSRETGKWFKSVYGSQLCAAAVESVYPSVVV